MKIRFITPLLGAALLLPAAWAQTAPAAPAAPRTPPVPTYIDPAAIHPELVLGPPPQPGTPAEAADLAEVHRLYDPASPELIAFAQKDARSQNIFLFSTIFGEGYTAQALPLIAALGRHLTSDAGIENGLLKARFQHPRPYRLDPALPSRCGVDNSFSYPSGHTMAAFLLAHAVAQMVPEKSQEIMARAQEFAEHRMVCAVHYRTDVDAGKLVALQMYGYMLSSPVYQKDMAAARTELRAFLHLPSEPPKQ